MYERPPRSDELYHYGVLGMHWGIRRYQNYDGTWKNAGKKHRSDQQSKPGDNVANAGGLFFGNKSKSSRPKVMVKKLSEIKPIGKEEDSSTRLTKVNPFYSPYTPATAMNCGNCVLANELRNQGYDATALGNSNGLSQKELKDTIKNLDKNSVKYPKVSIPNMSNTDQRDAYYQLIGLTNDPALEKKLITRGQKVEAEIKKSIASDYPNGSRGCMFIPGVTCSHWVSWEKDTSGKVVFENPQDPKADLTKTYFSQYTDYGLNVTQCSTIRLDNATFNDKVTELVGKSTNGEYIGVKNKKHKRERIKKL